MQTVLRSCGHGNLPTTTVMVFKAPGIKQWMELQQDKTLLSASNRQIMIIYPLPSICGCWTVGPDPLWTRNILDTLNKNCSSWLMSSIKRILMDSRPLMVHDWNHSQIKTWKTSVNTTHKDVTYLFYVQDILYSTSEILTTSRLLGRWRFVVCVVHGDLCGSAFTALVGFISIRNAFRNITKVFHR